VKRFIKFDTSPTIAGDAMVQCKIHYKDLGGVK